MRREGFELSVSRPKVLFKQENNKKLEPYEEVTIDVDEEYSSTVIDSINQRKGEMTDMRDTGQNKKRIIKTNSRNMFSEYLCASTMKSCYPYRWP